MPCRFVMVFFSACGFLYSEQIYAASISILKGCGWFCILHLHTIWKDGLLVGLVYLHIDADELLTAVSVDGFVCEQVSSWRDFMKGGKKVRWIIVRFEGMISVFTKWRGRCLKLNCVAGEERGDPTSKAQNWRSQQILCSTTSEARLKFDVSIN